MTLIDLDAGGLAVGLTLTPGVRYVFATCRDDDALPSGVVDLARLWADAIVVPSEAAAEGVARQIEGGPRIVVVPPFCPFPISAPAAARNIAMVLRAGDRREDTAQDRIVDAFFGTWRSDLMVEGVGWEHILGVPRWRGDLTDVRVAAIIGSQPLRHGALDSLVLEAMAAGCAVVAPFSPGMPDRFQCGRELAWYHDSAEAIALARDLVSNPRKADTMAACGNACVVGMTRERWIKDIEKACR